MHKILGYSNHTDLDAVSNNWHTSSSKPWSCSTGQNSVILDVLGDGKSSLFQPKHMDGSMYIGDHKANSYQSEDLSCERTDVADKEMRITAVLQPDGNHEEKHNTKFDTSVLPTTIGACVPPATHLKLVSHSIGCTSFPFSDPLYGGAHPSFGPQMQPHWLGMHNGIMVLPLDVAEEPVYVNAKQYHGILRRRQSRAKAEVERKLIKARKPYLHESRHIHAMRRARGSGGRFLNTKNLEKNAYEAAPDKSTSSGDTVSKYSSHQSSHRPVASQFERNVNSMTRQGEVTDSSFREMLSQRLYTSSSSFPGFQLSGQCTTSDKRVAGGNNNLKEFW